MERKIILYIAQSIDGYIAKADGNLDWLDKTPNPDKLDYGYFKFYEGISTTIMGNATYQEVLGFGVDWPYPDRKNFIISRNLKLELTTPNTFLINNLNINFINQIKTESKKDIWLVGGGNLIKTFIELEAVDEMIITTIPVLLGDGIKLFPPKFKECWFKVKDVNKFPNGVINTHYER